ncbi:MAG: hypothetical protein K9J16_10850 [Melioribacteraceae bacterium]|nr:hypothetical protein [Melioribacteraceae bacterium]MCF8355506.1 hypothetical protein [Melioribacteraceae bacterium]MCF8394194.1 hypothetical protein [Melioribacteraceae bacterium]MCF8419914.1 hypothetical protein [Melioribacteraceae bacterium]
MNHYDLAVSYKWIYDKEFVTLIEHIFQGLNLSTYIIHKKNIFEVTELVKHHGLTFTAYLDRASDEDEDFEELANFLSSSATYIINDYRQIEAAVDKAILHPVLEANKLPVPFTIIIPPLDKCELPKITKKQMKELGIPFIIKPAYYSGGGEGVITDARNFTQVMNERKINPDDNYLLQKKIIPAVNKSRRIWFRVFYAFGNVIPLWWDDRTHIYTEPADWETKKYPLKKIHNMMIKIAGLAKLDYFSTEFTIDETGKIWIIDYVNDQCDMRFKSKHIDGVPDKIVEKFIYFMAEKVRSI